MKPSLAKWLYHLHKGTTHGYATRKDCLMVRTKCYSNTLQRSNLLTRKICYPNYFSNGISLRKHIAGNFFHANRNTFFHTSNLTFLIGISQGIHVVAITLHITFVIHKLLFCKIRNNAEPKSQKRI